MTHEREIRAMEHTHDGGGLPCQTCNGTGWTHEACIGRFAKGDNRRPDGKCGQECGADECYIACPNCN